MKTHAEKEQGHEPMCGHVYEQVYEQAHDPVQELDETRERLPIRTQIEAYANPRRADFSASLTPTIDSSRVLGVRVGDLDAIKKKMTPVQKTAFLQEKPHLYYEEDLLHVRLLNELRDPQEARSAAEDFLCACTSWAITDGLSFRYLSDEDLLSMASDFLQNENEYAVRLGLLCILKRAPTRPDARQWVDLALQAKGQNDTKQLIDIKGWMLCEVMIYKPDLAWSILEDPAISRDVRLRAIAKCVESLRISNDDKEKLRALRKKLKEAKR